MSRGEIYNPKAFLRKRLFQRGQRTWGAGSKSGEPPVVMPRLVSAKWVQDERSQIQLTYNKPVFGTHAGFTGTADSGAGPVALTFSALDSNGSAVRHLAHAEGVQAGVVGLLSYAPGDLVDADSNPVGPETNWSIGNELWPVWLLTIPDFNLERGVPFSHDMAQYTDELAAAPYVYSTESGGLPSGLNWSGSVVEGSPQAQTDGQFWSAGATSGGGTAESNQVRWDVHVPPTAVSDIPNFEWTQNSNITPYDASVNFESSELMTFAELGAWPSGVSIEPNTGVISGAPADTGAFNTMQVRASNGLGAADSNVFTGTVTASSLQVLINHLSETLINGSGEELVSVA